MAQKKGLELVEERREQHGDGRHRQRRRNDTEHGLAVEERPRTRRHAIGDHERERHRPHRRKLIEQKRRHLAEDHGAGIEGERAHDRLVVRRVEDLIRLPEGEQRGEHDRHAEEDRKDLPRDAERDKPLMQRDEEIDERGHDQNDRDRPHRRTEKIPLPRPQSAELLFQE